MGVTRSTGEVLAPDLDHGADGLAWRARAREFARDVVGPVGEVLDQMEPAEVAAAGSPLFDLLAQAQREGLTRLGAPRRVGGVRLPAADALAVLEELAAADAALATLLLASPAPFRWAGALGGPALAREIAVPYFVADRTDWIGCSAVHAGPGAVRASPARDGWTLSGETPPVPAAAVATHALVACTCDDGARAALAVVVLDDAGVTRMVRHDVPGLRALCCARLVLDRVEVPAERLLAPALGGPRAAFGEAAGGVLAFGIGRAAYEGTLRWARERAWAGHPAVARLELRRMFALLDAARGPVHAAYFAGAGCPVPDEAAVADNAIAARAFAGAVACEVTTEAMRLCADDAAPSGAVGFLDGSAFRPGKLLRDAWAAHNHPKEDQHGLRQDA